MTTRQLQQTSAAQEKDGEFSSVEFRFYERPEDVHPNELYYSYEDIRAFKIAHRQCKKIAKRLAAREMSAHFRPEQGSKMASETARCLERMNNSCLRLQALSVKPSGIQDDSHIHW